MNLIRLVAILNLSNIPAMARGLAPTKNQKGRLIKPNIVNIATIAISATIATIATVTTIAIVAIVATVGLSIIATVAAIGIP